MKIEDVSPHEVGIDFVVNRRRSLIKLVEVAIKYPGVIRPVYELFSFENLDYLYENPQGRNVNLKLKKISDGLENSELRKELYNNKKILGLTTFNINDTKYVIVLSTNQKSKIQKDETSKESSSDGTPVDPPKNIYIVNKDCSKIHELKPDGNRSGNESGNGTIVIISGTYFKYAIKNKRVEDKCNQLSSTNTEDSINTDVNDPFKCILKLKKLFTETDKSNLHFIIETPSYATERVLHRAWKRIWGKYSPSLETISKQGISTILLSQVVNNSLIPYLFYDIIGLENEVKNYLNSMKIDVTENFEIRKAKILIVYVEIKINDRGRREKKINAIEIEELQTKKRIEIKFDKDVIEEIKYSDLIQGFLDKEMILLALQHKNSQEVLVHALDETVNDGDFVFYLEKQSQ